MTEQNIDLEIHTVPLVQVVTEEIEQVITWSDLVSDGDPNEVHDPATVADDELIGLVSRYLDRGDLGNVVVTRPETGNILIAPKAQYG